jgi:hypothetical protein
MIILHRRASGTSGRSVALLCPVPLLSGLSIVLTKCLGHNIQRVVGRFYGVKHKIYS